MIPLYHEFADETSLVFGSGPVGARTAEMARLLGRLRTTLDMAGVPADRRRKLPKSTVTEPPVWTALRSGVVNHRYVIEDALERADAGGDPS